MPTLRLRLYQLDRLLLRRLPELHESLSAAGAATAAFAAPWLLPLFASFTALDAAAAARLWDAALAGGGWAPFFGAALAVIRALAPALARAGTALETILPILAAPRLHYAAAAGARDEPVGSRAEAARLAALASAALHDEACRVSAAELEELEANWRVYGAIRD
jgi:hypothetical protein